jgi:hypothetical protein
LIVKATDVGELTAELLAYGSEGRVSRVFRSSAYVQTGRDFFLLLRGGPRSPMSINVTTTQDFGDVVAPDERCLVAGGEVRFGKVTVQTKEGRLYRGRLGMGTTVSPVPASVLVKGMAAVRLLYGVSDQPLSVASGESFKRFVESVLVPAAHGDMAGVYAPQNYLPLVGAGGGFTPAGDDVVGGFTAAFNHAAHACGLREVVLPREELEKRTVPESATLLEYAQRCLVDEEVENMVLSSFGERHGMFVRDLLQMARRGHTSGLDASVGVILAVAVIRELRNRDGTLERCLAATRLGRQGTL